MTFGQGLGLGLGRRQGRGGAPPAVDLQPYHPPSPNSNPNPTPTPTPALILTPTLTLTLTHPQPHPNPNPTPTQPQPQPQPGAPRQRHGDACAALPRCPAARREDNHEHGAAQGRRHRCRPSRSQAAAVSDVTWSSRASALWSRHFSTARYTSGADIYSPSVSVSVIGDSRENAAKAIMN